MKIRAATVNEAGGDFIIRELEMEEPRESEVVVRIVGAGICHTDLVARDQHLPIPLPAVFGHEGAGVVEKVGSKVTKVEPGDHVVLAWGACGQCPSCLSGRDPYCHNFFLYNFHGARPDGTVTLKDEHGVVHGSFFGQSSFASHALADQRNVVKVPKDVPLDVLAPLGCGVMTGAGAVINSLKVRPGSTIAVFGIGTVGMSAVAAAKLVGCTTIIAVDVQEGRLKKAMELGATHVVHAGHADPVQAVLDITGGGVQYSLECVGNPAVLRQATDCLAMPGVCGLVGVTAPGTEVVLDMDRIMNGRAVQGIIEGDAIPELFIPQLIELYKQGRFPFDQLITKYPFEEINRAVHDMESGAVVKPVLTP
ncbi:aryl-alcohol dehydrogenase [Desulfacinum infernum DSM 9756]|uniref:Aryl-alcohol dehydrogenase n=1 Tax=Desulfacinum infernum DSM 9756 TaxID=1121391 RepID=A0A1M5G7A9_9BACT|nr:NAD(P)-dependent alcohol dehydrogenase [Desulfacinum infernum]SHF99351.1 aryl-alcohol dehydrogenase [Desulfacinum infernum DSM 9756]